MTTTTVYRSVEQSRMSPQETTRLPVVPARIVHRAIVNLELKPGGGGEFERTIQSGECERHPEWYIG